MQSSPLDIIPPQAIEFEYAVLKAIWDDPSTLHRVRRVLQPHMFYRADNSAIYQIMLDLADQGAPVDLLTVSDHAVQQNITDARTVHLAWVVGSEACAASMNAMYYALAVREAWAKRAIVQVCTAAVQSIGASDLASVKQHLLDSIKDISTGHDIEGRDTLDELSDMVISGWDNPQPQIPFWIKPPHDYVQTVDRGNLYVVGASPSVGKTACLTQGAVLAAQHGFTALFISYEMDAKSIWCRMISQSCSLPMYVITECPTQALAVQISNTMAELQKLPIRISKPVTSDVNALAALIHAHRPDIVFVDYMQLVRGIGDNRVQQVGNVAQTLKDVAMSVPCAVVAASQLSRAAFDEKAYRPELHHLRESGEIEAVADVILLLWRDKREQPVNGHYVTRYVRVAKNRNGPVWERRVLFDLKCALWDPADVPLDNMPPNGV